MFKNQDYKLKKLPEIFRYLKQIPKGTLFAFIEAGE
jgi:hypothetical protein